MESNASDLPYRGLSAKEAADRMSRGQHNKQPPTAGKSVWKILADNFFTLFNLLNFVLAATLIAVGSYRNLLFLGVVFSNTIIGAVQELRAKRTIDRLQLISAPKAQAIRDGTVVELDMEDIVLDDLLLLRPGDQLSVDSIVTDGQGAMNESLLTGESEPVDKRPGDELLSGSYVTEGTLYARVARVGADSYAAQLTQRAKTIKKPHSELMQSMRYIIRVVSAVLVPLGLILFYKQYFTLGRDLHDAVTSTVAAVLGMIPEGLMLLTSVALAVGVVRLGKRNTLVQDLYGIESLARVDTLCVDKTGTITEGSMAVIGVEPLGGAKTAEIDAQLGLLVSSLSDNNATFAALRARFPDVAPDGLMHAVPFSSARKWSGACFSGSGTCVIGAAEFILGKRVDHVLRDKIAVHSSRGYRVLLFCHSPSPMTDSTLPKDLTPCALVLLSDVLRDDAHEAIAFFAEQGVQIKVISGDNPLTVMSVAKQAGLTGAEAAIDATTLDTPEKLEAAANEYTIFGRVTPEQKKDLILALKAQGHTVGMMGDGVNDIPALKASDCSIAMAGGSDAARRVSQLTLLDASFSAVPQIVLEGRRVINNITRASSLFLVKTIFSFLLSLLLVFIAAHYPFSPIQMTLISSLTVGIPSFFLALEPSSARVQGNFLYNVLRNALPGGLTIVIQILLIFLLSGSLNLSEEQQSTMAMFTTAFSGLTVLFLTCLPINLPRGFLLGGVTVAFVVIVSFFSGVFYLVPLTPALIALTSGLMVLAVPLMLLLRWSVKRVLR